MLEKKWLAFVNAFQLALVGRGGLLARRSLTLKSCTPMQANMNCRRVVTSTMFPIVRMATKTHCTTC